MRKKLIFGTLIFISQFVFAQRIYKPNSILSTGNWYKIAVPDEGVYKIDIAFLNSIGISANNIPSSSVRLFGYAGAMLPEANSVQRPDDLPEVALMAMDGGDGILNGADHLLFYSTGPSAWNYNTGRQEFIKTKNIYADRSFYFISIGGNGKRINSGPSITSPATDVQSYDFRFWHESDSVNFLSSGKNWYGEEFSSGGGGKVLQRSFPVSIPNPILPSQLKIRSDFISRSAGAFSKCTVSLNNLPVIVHDIAFTGTGPYDPFGVEDQRSGTFSLTQSQIDIRYQYAPGNPASQGWLDHFSFTTRCLLSMNGIDQLFFRDLNSVAAGNVARFRIQNAQSAMQVWDISNAQEPLFMQGNFSGLEFSFTSNADVLKEYVAFNSANIKIPLFAGSVPVQDLHKSSVADLIIITEKSFLPEANRLAQHHAQRDNLRVSVATTEQIFNEFSSGVTDPAALRDFVKMYYDKAGSNTALKPKYLLLFGDASFDYKSRINNNTNLLPAWQTANSLDPLASYTSDDFYGFLDDNEDINNSGIINLLDVGIGRIPANNVTAAKAVVDKILKYTNPESLGPWRNEITFVADDEDNNLHIRDAEAIAANAFATNNLFNQEKIYLDAYRQESGSGGERYPSANLAINNKMSSGNLIWNYLGHGSYRRLAEEIVLDQEIVNGLNNPNKLPLFITATCDFSPYDNPIQFSLGEYLLMKPFSGAIALVTSTRVVFANSNKNINDNYLKAAMTPDLNGKYLSLGSSIMEAKNFNYANFTDLANNRKFTLLGDPALTLAFPQHRVITTAINGVAIPGAADTLKALGKYTISGAVTDISGNIMNNFSGVAYPLIFDKPVSITTIGNDPTSIPFNFLAQKNIIYRGKVSVVNGKFNYSFIVPKDISVPVGNGRISYYSENGNEDANGIFNSIKIGGTSGSVIADNEGPVIRAYLNDENFINGSLSNATPVLLLKLADSSGINATGAGIGHDITAVLDNDNRKIFELNAAYETELDTYTRGRVRFQLPKLENGPHSLKIKAWDVFNNSSEYLLEFRVANENVLEISNVLNYPNPFTSNTNFWFEHNHPGEDLLVGIKIFTITGKIVKAIKKTINTVGNRSSEIVWDGRDEYGEKLGRGVYLYELMVRTGSKKAIVLSKLMLL